MNSISTVTVSVPNVAATTRVAGSEGLTVAPEIGRPVCRYRIRLSGQVASRVLVCSVPDTASETKSPRLAAVWLQASSRSTGGQATTLTRMGVFTDPTQNVPV